MNVEPVSLSLFHLEPWPCHLLVTDPDAVPPHRPQSDALLYNLRAPQVGHHLRALLQDGCRVARLERLQGPVVPRVDRSEDHRLSALPFQKKSVLHALKFSLEKLIDLRIFSLVLLTHEKRLKINCLIKISM